MSFKDSNSESKPIQKAVSDSNARFESQNTLCERVFETEIGNKYEAQRTVF